MSQCETWHPFRIGLLLKKYFGDVDQAALGSLVVLSYFLLVRSPRDAEACVMRSSPVNGVLTLKSLPHDLVELMLDESGVARKELSNKVITFSGLE